MLINTSQLTPKEVRQLGETGRVYLYDADTQEEIPTNPLRWLGTYENGIKGGVRYRGTTLGVTVVDLNTSTKGLLVADSFPGRKVVAKIWHGYSPSEWRLLVSRARGWEGNEADNGRLQTQATRWGS